MENEILFEADGENAPVSVYGSAFDTAKGTFIYAVVYENTAPPPYTAHSEYIVLKTDDEIKVLNWDKKNNFSGLYEADGDVYIASSGYSPHNSGRWSNSFSDLYSYDKEGGKLYSIAEDFGDKFNSIEVIGLA